MKRFYYVKYPAAETAGSPFESLCFDVIPASDARRESLRKDFGQAGMTDIWNYVRDHRV